MISLVLTGCRPLLLNIMIENFYRAFEDRHRGSRELIKERLNIYRSFIEPLLSIYPEAKGLDLGCGRGEWLEILGSLGVDGLGVDLDSGMLNACHERGLNAIQANAIEYLTSLSNESILVISAFHLIEHISFKDLEKLLGEAKRILVPGGLLILETPNPENITVATCNFYLDPSHERPIPPELLLFLTEFLGFSKNKVLRLQEMAQIRNSQSLSLSDVLGGASPDYAVVAQKYADSKILNMSRNAFELEYGISTYGLAQKYSQQQTQLLNAMQEKLEKAENAQQILTLVLNSHSWKITSPLRWLGLQYRRLHQDGIVKRSKAFIKKAIRILSRNRYYSALGPGGVRGGELISEDQLNLRAKKIYTDLKSAIKKNN